MTVYTALNRGWLRTLPQYPLKGKIMVEGDSVQWWPPHLSTFYEKLNGGAALATAAVLSGCVIEWTNENGVDQPWLVGHNWAVEISLITKTLSI